MNVFPRFRRLLFIGFILVKHGVDECVPRTPLFRSLRFLLLFSSLRWNRREIPPRGVRIRAALEELGPIFVKLGQVLSTRFDLLPEDIITELTLLQDQVPPFSGTLAKTLIEASLQAPLSQHFHSFEEIPLASASIAQVHAAVLWSGEKVVIKILRPHIDKTIKKDLELLKAIAKLAHRYWKGVQGFKPREILAELEKSLFDELDLLREAANASQLKRNFKNSLLLQVPTIYWDLTRTNILIMEHMVGIPVTDPVRLTQMGFNCRQLAEQAIEIFLTQAFRDCFFHADMHPGNILIAAHDPKHPRYIALDFGIMGILNAADQHYLAQNLLAFLKRDYRRVAALHLESGWIPDTTRLDEFESAIRAVSEPIFERSSKEISFAELLFRLFKTATRFQINIQPQLILLQKTLMNIESLSRQLYPEIDITKTAQPFLEKWVKKQVGISALMRKLKTHAPEWIEQLPEIPNLLYTVLGQMAKVNQPYPSHPIPAPQHKMSWKDICIGFLLGGNLVLLWHVIRSYL